MPNFATKFVRPVKLCSITTLVLVLPFAAGTVPARAQDIFGFFRALSQPAAPAPAPAPFQYGPAPAIDRPKPRVRSRPKPVPLEQSAIKTPVEPRPPGEIENPVPSLLADSTLRPGDMVMFPDGLRVFTGTPGNQHKLADFKLVSQAGKAVTRATRSLVAGLRPSENAAWNTDGFRAGGKLAVNTRDVETTGSVKRTGRGIGSRSR